MLITFAYIVTWTASEKGVRQALLERNKTQNNSMCKMAIC